MQCKTSCARGTPKQDTANQPPHNLLQPGAVCTEIHDAITFIVLHPVSRYLSPCLSVSWLVSCAAHRPSSGAADLPLQPLLKKASNSFETFLQNSKTKNQEPSAVVQWRIQLYLGQLKARHQSTCSTPYPKYAAPVSRKSGRHCTEVHAEHGGFSAGKHWPQSCDVHV